MELDYLFAHWIDVRKGAMLSIGQQLRMGRFPGFEECTLVVDPFCVEYSTDRSQSVWPVILQNLMTEERKAEGAEVQPRS